MTTGRPAVRSFRKFILQPATLNLAFVLLPFYCLSALGAQEKNPERLPIESPAKGVRLIGTRNDWVGLQLSNPKLSADGKFVYGIQETQYRLVKVDRETNQVIATKNFGRSMFDFAVGRQAIILLVTEFSDEEKRWKSRVSILSLDLETLDSTDVSSLSEGDAVESTAPFTWVKISQNSKLLLLYSTDRVEVREVSTLKSLGAFHSNNVFGSVFLPDGTVYDPADRKVWKPGSVQMNTFDQELIPIHQFLTSCGKYVAVQRQGKVGVFLWGDDNVRELPTPSNLLAHSYESTVISSTGNRLAAVSFQGHDARLLVWDLVDEKLLVEVKVPRRRFTPWFDDSDRLFLQHAENGQFFAVPELKELKSMVQENSVVPSLDFQVVSNRKGTLSYLSGGGGRIVELDSGRVVRLETPIEWAQFAPESEWLVGNSFDERSQANQLNWVNVSDSNKSQTTVVDRMDSGVGNAIISGLLGVRRDPPPRLPSQMCAGLQFVNDGRQLNASLTLQPEGPVVSFWNPIDRKRTEQIQLSEVAGLEDIEEPMVAGFSQDGIRMLVGTKGRLTLLDLKDKAVIREVSIPPEFTSENGRLQFSHDGRWILLTDSARTQWVERNIVLDAKSLETVKTYRRSTSPMICRFASNAPRLLMCEVSTGKTTCLDTDTWQTVGEYKAGDREILNADISGDGKRIIFSLADTRIEVWELDEME